MSGLIALFHRDGRPTDAGDFVRLMAGIAHRGPDGTGVWRSGAVALGHARLVVTAADAQQPQPLIDGDDAIVFTGRLDNRAELAALLRPRRPAADPALALLAYREWGAGSARCLLGDFAYVIWDGARRTLVAARDALGQKTLFYHSTDRLVIVASEPRAILAHRAVPREVNERVAAEYLTGIVSTREETLNAAVRRVLPAHVLVADAGTCQAFRYWDFDSAREIRYAEPREYAEHFLELFTQAVRCRLDATCAVAVFLSGGVDSSAVAGMARRIAEQERRPCFALALRFPGLQCDEEVHIEAVARHTGIPVRALNMVAARADAYRAEASSAMDVPSFPNGTILDPLRVAAREAGARVVLTGYGGDDWFTGSPAHTTDLLRRGRPIAAWRQLCEDARLPGRGYTRTNLALAAVAPLAPRTVRSAVRIFRRSGAACPWIRPEFLRKAGLQGGRNGAAPARPFCSAAQAEMHRVATSAVTLIGDEIEERAAAAAGIEQRHPFNDRRIAEFGLALPEEQRWYAGETKVVVRRAMQIAGAVPDDVLCRRDKAEFSSSLVDAIEAFGGEAAFAALRTAERGWVDAAKARELHRRMMALYSRKDESYIPLSDALWSILSVELWLSALETNRARPASGEF